jgi:hypothetical protein
VTRCSRARRGGLALVVVLTALLATACYRSEVALEVQEDGSGTLGVLLAIEPELAQRAADAVGQGGAFPGDPCAGIDQAAMDLDSLPSGSTAEPYDEDGYCGVRVAIPFEDGADLEQLLLDAFGVRAADLPSNFREFALARDGDGWRFTAAVEAPGTGMLGTLAGQYLEGAFNRVEVRLPGTVVDHNADRVEDGTLVWELEPLGETRTMEARSSLSAAGGDAGAGGDDDGFPVLAVLVPVLVLAAAGAAFVLWRRRGPRTPPGATPPPRSADL